MDNGSSKQRTVIALKIMAMYRERMSVLDVFAFLYTTKKATWYS